MPRGSVKWAVPARPDDRDQLRSDLTRHNVEVKVQEDLEGGSAATHSTSSTSTSPTATRWCTSWGDDWVRFGRAGAASAASQIPGSARTSSTTRGCSAARCGDILYAVGSLARALPWQVTTD